MSWFDFKLPKGYQYIGLLSNNGPFLATLCTKLNLEMVTTNIFTFVGFSNPRQREEAKLGKGINKSAFHNAFYNYPYKKKKEELFQPDENLFYVYFKESVPSVKQFHLENIEEYYEFKDIKDM